MLEEKSSKVSSLRRKFLWLYIIAALACVLAATVVSLAFISANNAKSPAAETQPPSSNNNDPATQNNPQTPTSGGDITTGGTETPDTGDEPIVIPEGSVQWITAPGISTGTLVLVNAEHPYLSANALNQSGNIQIVNVKENRTSDTKNLQVSANTLELSYAFVDALCKMSDAMVLGCNNTTRDIMVNTGFKRDTDPNNSEYYTGLSAELRMIDLTQTPTRYYQLKDPDAVSTAISQWLTTNCHNFGIIQRYPASKVTQTGISASVSQYRYVGEVHAKYMHEMNYSLEEYLDAIKAYNFNKRLDITVDDVEYSLYFVKETDAAVKGIPVPKNTTYEISGNNVDGYIVMIQKQSIQNLHIHATGIFLHVKKPT